MQGDKALEKLFKRFLLNQCTAGEIKTLLRHFAAGEDEDLLKTLVRKELDRLDEYAGSSTVGPALLESIFEKIKVTVAADEQEKRKTVVPLYRHRRFWFAAVAACILLICSAVVFLQPGERQKEAMAHLPKQTRPVEEISPGQTNAVLTLADGTTIVLDSVSDGALAQQGGIKLLKLNGQITYDKAAAVAGGEALYNRVATARGNQYQLVLSDGSKVWLNAASSIRFPIAFTGRERTVVVSGEAYFEIAKDPSKPFRVSILSNNSVAGEVEVLGTHFNVNAYDDEEQVKTTLIEGRVKVKNSKATQLLSVGEQAAFENNGINISKDIDPASVMAWKEGYFSFNNTDLRTLLRQVARWYDVDVVFEGKGIGETFSGRISRNVPLSKLLKVLELNDVKVKMQGRQLIVQP